MLNHTKVTTTEILNVDMSDAIRTQHKFESEYAAKMHKIDSIKAARINDGFDDMLKTLGL